MLTYGIPNMKLDKREVVARRIALMEKEGIKFLCNATVGENVEPQLLIKDFDATVICTGATLPRDLPVEGRNLKGVHFAMDFLTVSTQAVLQGQRRMPRRSRAKGKDVVVLGGGDTGTDCVGTSMRQGCRACSRSRSWPCRRWIAPRTIRGRSGPRSTRWTTARKRPPRNSAPTRACI